jgi:HPt (histidine-containing phosphotransfer) domain-containing protein
MEISMIDWSRVTTLREEVGEEDFEEVVDLFLEEVDEAVHRLEKDVNFASLGEDLHFLKGSALSLGFRQFSALCQAGENTCAEGAPDNVDLSEIINNYKASRAAFLSELKSVIAS